MSLDITNIKMPDRMPSFWSEEREVTISDLAKPAAVGPDFNRVDDRMAFWSGETGMYDRMPSVWTEGMEVAIGDLVGLAAVDPHFNRVRDLAVFWRGEEEIDSERGQPPAVNAPFSLNSFDYLGWGDISESMREELMKLRELIDTLENYASAKHKGLVDEQVLARGAFDRLEEEVDEVASGLEENNDAPSGESALVANQPDAYSELTGSDFDWRDEGAIISYVLEMAA